MIILDTHIWLWWTHADPQLSDEFVRTIQTHQPQGLGISAISCWELAKLVERGRLRLPTTTVLWLHKALAQTGVKLLPITPEIAADACALPQPFHRDPADQLIVASARIHNCRLLTVDTKIKAYPHVKTD